MDEFIAAPLQKSLFQKLILVIAVKNILHGGPESLLPLEDCLLGDNVWGDFVFQASLEEKMGEILDVVVGVVVNSYNVVVVGQITLVDNEGSRAILGKVGSQESSLSNLIPASTILSSNGMAFEQDLVFVTEFNSLNVNRITGNGNSVPSPAHGSVGRSECLREAKFFYLGSRGSNGWFLENGTNSLSGFDGVVQDLVVGFVTGLTRQIIGLPGASVKIWLDPFVDNQIRGIVGHLFTGNVNHRWGRDILAEGNTFHLGGRICAQVATKRSRVVPCALGNISAHKTSSR
mmetsp:Transcript_5461/g.12982  ORF Transcript_5461/g.12982 Transcript_5461/m.12982 type:complete len:289 (-) Transcript_5461:136-1002(-)